MAVGSLVLDSSKLGRRFSLLLVYMRRSFSPSHLCEKKFLSFLPMMWEEASLLLTYVRKRISPSRVKKSFLPSHYVRRSFSHRLKGTAFTMPNMRRSFSPSCYVRNSFSLSYLCEKHFLTFSCLWEGSSCLLTYVKKTFLPPHKVRRSFSRTDGSNGARCQLHAVMLKFGHAAAPLVLA